MNALSFSHFVKVRILAPNLAPAPVPELGFVLQVAGVGSAIGSAIALRARMRDGDIDTWRITTAWGTLGLVVGAGIVVGFAL